MAKPAMTFEQAKAAYVHRFTMEHVPQWASKSMSDGKYPAPQFRTDREWFESTMFPPNNPYAMSSRDTSCHSTNQTWPLGVRLAAPYQRVSMYA